MFKTLERCLTISCQIVPFSRFDLSPEFIAKLIKKLGAKVPIKISVAKARTANLKVYVPLLKYLEVAGLNSGQLEHKWQTMQNWNKWRSYSCPTNDVLTDLIQQQDNQDEEEDEDVFNEIKSVKDYVLAKSGYPLTCKQFEINPLSGKF